ncbi:MAG: restriction endonuclease subunit S [Bacteroidaceae bacterium]|nr:restriction endonuclease subunit S [Bacteroidaceae bacterium]
MNKDIPYVETLPSHWSVIQNRFLFYYDGQKVGNAHKDYQLLSLTTGGVKERDINVSGGKVPASYDNYQTVKKGQMVFCLFDLDCSAVFSGISNYDGMITSAYDVFSNTEMIDNGFADYWFKYVFSNRYYKMFSKSIRYTITGDMFRSLKTPVPPIKEQKRISAFLLEQETKVDALIANVQAQIEKLKAYKQSVITETVTKGLDPNAPMKDSGVEWIGEIPTTWSTIRVKQLLHERKERSVEGEEEPLSMSQKLGLVPTKMLETIPNMASSFIGAKLAYVNDLVFNKLKAHLGVFSVSKYDGLVSPDYAVYYSTGVVNLKYLEYLFKTPQCISEFRKRSTGIAAGLTRLYTDDLFAIECPLPRDDEQQEIVNYLDTKCSQIDQLVSIKQTKIEKLEQYKKSLIYEYVTGKKEVV